ncbi:hypothetical protein BsWGS_13717 [Bradybaena similaris]
MDTRLQPFLRSLHRLFPVSTSPELSPCLHNGAVSDPADRIPSYSATSEPSLSQAALDNKAIIPETEDGGRPRDSRGTFAKAREKLGNTFSCCACTGRCWCAALKKFFPFVTIMKDYSLGYDLPCDVIAGLTVGIMYIPQGTFAVITMMIGSVVDKGHVAWQQGELQGAISDLNSGHNITHVLGDEDTSTLDSDNQTDSKSTYRSEHLMELASLKVGYAMAVTFAVGVLQIALGIMRLGFVTAFLSDPLISGFTTGAAIHVFSSQIKDAFGVKVERYSGPFKLILVFRDFFTRIDQTNLVELSSTVVAIIVLLIVREGINNNKCVKERLRGIPLPGELLLIVVGTVLSVHFSLHDKYNMVVIGHIPRGFPGFSVSFVKYLPDVIGESFAICFTAFAISFAIAKILADKNDYTLDPNQELLAHGITNVVGSMFSSFCSAASLSRSMVQEGVGGKTQVVSLIASLLVLIVLLTLAPLFEALPNSILAAIIIVSLKGLFQQFGEVPKLWKVSSVDCTVWLVTFTATVLLDVDLGLLIGLIYNLVPVLLLTQEPYYCLQGRLPNTDIFVDMKLYPEAVPVPGIQIFRFDSPVFFANIESFKTALIQETGVCPHALKQMKAHEKHPQSMLHHHEVNIGTPDTWPDKTGESNDHTKPLTSRHISAGGETHAVIIDATGIQKVDSVTARALTKIVLEYREVDVEVLLGECTEHVTAILRSPGSYIHRRNVCSSVLQAVLVAQKARELPREVVVCTYTMDPQDFLEFRWDQSVKSETCPLSAVDPQKDQ